jgi:hypothetical protein
MSVDMRYAGQNYELSVPLPAGAVGPETIDGLAAGFAALHQRLYGFVADQSSVPELIEWCGGELSNEWIANPHNPSAWDFDPAYRILRFVGLTNGRISVNRAGSGKISSKRYAT